MIPGGVDPHTHLELPFGGTTTSDTFETGTRAAAYGGTTCIIDFAVQTRGTSTLKALDDWHAQGAGQDRDRLRLPHDRHRHAAGAHRRDAQPRRCRHHQLQAVHGLSGRAAVRRRHHLSRHAQGRRGRHAGLHACRERHRHRRIGEDRAGAEPHRTEISCADPADAAGSRGRAPRARRSPKWRGRRSISCT